MQIAKITHLVIFIISLAACQEKSETVRLKNPYDEKSTSPSVTNKTLRNTSIREANKDDVQPLDKNNKLYEYFSQCSALYKLASQYPEILGENVKPNLLISRMGSKINQKGAIYFGKKLGKEEFSVSKDIHGRFQDMKIIFSKSFEILINDF